MFIRVFVLVDISIELKLNLLPSFSFGFRFGNNWLGLYSLSSIFQFEICLQYLCFGVGNGFAFLSATLNGS